MYMYLHDISDNILALDSKVDSEGPTGAPSNVFNFSSGSCKPKKYAKGN